MDNNQNFGGQPQQPVNNNPYGQSQQPVNNAPYGQPQQPVNNGPFGQQYMQPKQPPKFNMYELVSIICSVVGFLLVIFGTIFTCTCSAEKSIKEGYSTHLIFIMTISGIVVAVAGILLAVLALKKTDAPVKAGKLSKISIVVGVAAVVFGVLPLVTICGYNMLLDSESGKVGSYNWNDLFNY